MKHRRAGRKLRRNSSHRKALMRNLLTSLILHNRITTTEAKAKELRSYAEKAVTLAKQGTLHARRQAATMLYDPQALQKLFNEMPERFKERQGGYTRVLKVGNRMGDNARIAMIEYLDATEESESTEAAAEASED